MKQVKFVRISDGHGVIVWGDSLLLFLTQLWNSFKVLGISECLVRKSMEYIWAFFFSQNTETKHALVKSSMRTHHFQGTHE